MKIMKCKYCEFGASEDDDHYCTKCHNGEVSMANVITSIMRAFEIHMPLDAESDFSDLGNCIGACLKEDVHVVDDELFDFIHGLAHGLNIQLKWKK